MVKSARSVSCIKTVKNLDSYAKINMSLAERHQATIKFFKDAQAILGKKGQNYNHDGNAFSGFCDNGKEFGIAPEVCFWIMAEKHNRAIKSFLKGQTPSEDIHGRLMDLANYAALLSVYLKTKGKRNG